MIQRIQTVYLFLAAALLAAFAFMLPVFELDKLSNIGLGQMLSDPTVKTLTMVAAGITAAVALLAIFLYANRKVQMKVIMGAVLFNIITLALVGYDYYDISRSDIVNIKIGFEIAFPIISIILLFLANSGVKKDDKLVRQADRLR